ncbi:hypothetical protein [Burkholderia multivorans]|uniref:hypothetical protein n=1 Tax=Burkholderia multivorans TaxID=87883 RepID=UPI00285CFA81|nr:hypothetical protein [Burkholderia multivorans]MDR9064078.1 hypothetical protein [Burkholderia multivorans]MDR9071949.1 hypothetical protein [Burkholderia multivorans]MDR9082755.1 hypothetical protein [Burkholderia multivorans]MDR9091858.1 hypothetical protein [Burkholderia multivorans]
MNQVYLETARRLTQVAPLIFKDDTFALKGGTIIALSGRFPQQAHVGNLTGNLLH